MQPQGQSQLQVLHDHLEGIDNDIATIEAPVDELNTLLGDVIDLLGKPKVMSDDLAKIGEVLSEIQSVAADATWLPEVGEAAGALSKVLIPVVREPPPAGGIGEVRTSLNEIDVVLTPLKNRLSEAQKPVKKVHDAIHKVEFDVKKLEVGTQALIRRYGASPPENVEKCARGLNKGIETAANELHEAKKATIDQLTAYLSPLSEMENAFHRVDGYLNRIETVFNELDGFRKALREVTHAVHTAEAYGKKKIEELFTWIGRHTYPKLYKKIKRELDNANRFVNQMIGKVAHFAMDPVKREVDKFEAIIKEEVNKIPGVQALETVMDQVEKELEKLEDEIVDTLSGECGKVLEPT